MTAPDPQARDLLVAPFYKGDSSGSLDLALQPRSPRPGEVADIDRAIGADSIRQALLLRLLTPLGSLDPLGHLGYGSLLHELIGQLNTPTTRQLARSYTLRAISQDPRVEEVLDLQVLEPTEAGKNTVRIQVMVKAMKLTEPIELGIEVAL